MGDQRKGNWQLVMKQQPQAKQKLTDNELEQKMADARSSQKMNKPLKSEQAIDITNLVVVKDAA